MNVGDYLAQITGASNPVVTTQFMGFSPVYADKMHRGIDVGVPAGSTILSPVSGTIVDPKTANTDTGLGRAIVLKDEQGEFLYFGHTLSGSLLSPGTHVERGQQIGIVGSPATQLPGENTTGPHIHFEVRRNGLFNQQINPLGFLEGLFGQPSGPALPKPSPPSIPAVPPSTQPVAPPSTEPPDFPPVFGEPWTSKPSEANPPGSPVPLPDITLVPPTSIPTPFGPKDIFPGVKVNTEWILRGILTIIAIILIMVGLFRLTSAVPGPDLKDVVKLAEAAG